MTDALDLHLSDDERALYEIFGRGGTFYRDLANGIDCLNGRDAGRVRGLRVIHRLHPSLVGRHQLIGCPHHLTPKELQRT